MSSVDNLINKVAESCKGVMKKKIEQKHGQEILGNSTVQVTWSMDEITIYIPTKFRSKNICIQYKE